MTTPLLTRRTLVGGTLGASLGLGALSEIAADAAGRGPHGLRGPLPRRVDVVVVGAGIAGLVTARRIAGQGRSVLLLEARHRVGGRVLNHELRSGEVIEAGGAFVGPTQDHILRLARQLRVPTFPEYNTGRSVYVSSTLGRVEYSGTVPPDPTILPDAAILLDKIDRMAAEIAVDAPWAHPQARTWDTMTLGDFIRANAVANPRGVTNLIKSWSQPGFGADPDELSLLFTLWYVACSGNETTVGTFARNSDTAAGAQERRLVGGSQLIPLRMARGLGDLLALRAPVTRVVQRDHHAEVHTRRGTVRCKRVVVAAPPELVLGIDWFPRLPVQRRRLLKSQDMGKLMKCDAVYRTPFWRADGLNGFGINDSGAARTVFDNSPPDGTPGVLAGLRRRVDLARLRPPAVGPAPARGPGGLRGHVRRAGAAPRRLHRAGLDQGALDPRRPHRDPCRRRFLPTVRTGHPAAVRPRALGRHRDVDVLVRLHGRRRAIRRARRARGPGAAAVTAAPPGPRPRDQDGASQDGG